MERLFEWTREEMRHTHGGCVVLRVICDKPLGEMLAAVHFTAMTQRLCAWAEESLLPDAVADLENAATKGRLYAFRPHTLRIALQTAKRGRGWQISLSVSLTKGSETAFHRVLETFWDKDGRYQLKKPLNGMRKRHILPEKRARKAQKEA